MRRTSPPDLTEHDLAIAFMTDALFCSSLKVGDRPSGRQLLAAIREAMKTHRGWNGCTRAVAAAFASTPAAAERREAWCRKLVEEALSSADFQPGTAFIE